MTALPINPTDILAAAARLDGIAARTPAISSTTLDGFVGAPVLCKAECLQRTGSFKFRGAYNHAAALPDEVRARGIVGASSGNHAQALGLAARLLGIPCTVVIPADAPEAKVSGVAALGAQIVTYDRHAGDRDALVAQIAAEHGMAVIPSASSPYVMAGAGTAALELLIDHPDITTLIVPVGGGGLAAGTAVIAKHLNPKIRVVGVEPQAGADTLHSLRVGYRITLREVPRTIADGLGHTTPSELPWQVNSLLLDDVVTVTDADIALAMEYAFRHLKVVAEPSGATALAALISEAVPTDGGPLGVVISGGGVDLPVFHDLTSARRSRRGQPAHA